MKKLHRFFGWLFMTETYMSSLSREELMDRALGKKGAADFRRRFPNSD